MELGTESNEIYSKAFGAHIAFPIMQLGGKPWPVDTKAPKFRVNKYTIMADDRIPPGMVIFGMPEFTPPPQPGPMYGFNCAGEIRPDGPIQHPVQDPVTAAFAFEALIKKIHPNGGERVEPFGILKKIPCKKKERIRVLEAQNANLRKVNKSLMEIRERLMDDLSQKIGADLQRKYNSDKVVFVIMDGRIHPDPGVVVHAVHTDWGNILAFYDGHDWMAKGLNTRPHKISESHIHWYKKIS